MKKLLFSGLLIFILLSFVSVASATLLNFDDIYSGSGWTTIPDGYGGLNWTNAEVVIEGYAGYYTQSAVSGNYAADNGGGNPLTVSSSGTFDFSGAWFTPANGSQPGDISVEAFLGVASQGTQLIDLTDAAPLWVDFAFTGIDQLVFTPTSTGHPSYFAFDGFTYNANPVPEPATMILFGLGLLGVAGVSRRKK